MTREEMVDALVEHYVECILEINAEEWISERLRYGMTQAMAFKPYDQRTDEEIKAEYDEMFEEDSQ